MLRLSFVDLPDYYTLLLRANVNANNNFFDGLRTYTAEIPPLKSFLKKCFHDVDPKGSFDSIIKSLGWTGYRNRLASIFLQKSITGRFPDDSKTDILKDILDFEDCYSQYTVEGYSRLFLLGFYLKMSQGEDSSNWTGMIPLELRDYLKSSKVKIVKIDWLIFMLIHLHSYIGEEGVREVIKKSDDWVDIFSNLQIEQKEEFLENALAYGASINERDAFCGIVMG